MKKVLILKTSTMVYLLKFNNGNTLKFAQRIKKFSTDEAEFWFSAGALSNLHASKNIHPNFTSRY
jgi:hypothetical protein